MGLESYILNEKKEVVKAKGILEWGSFFENFSNRKVAKTNVGNYEVSTVFIGIDHSYKENTPPLVFETMVFDAKGNGEETHRYCTWEQAEKGHNEIVKQLTEKNEP